MVKLTNPLMSMGAAGTVNGMITFQQNKGRAYARKTPKPKQPNTPQQLFRKQMVAFLNTAWAKPEVNQADWNAANPNAQQSGYNFYVSTNLKRWAQRTPPINLPQPGNAITPTAPTSVTATATGNTIDATITRPQPRGNWWGVYMQLDGGIVVPEPQFLSHIVYWGTTNTAASFTIAFPNVPGGTYNLFIWPFSKTGTFNPPTSATSVTVPG